MKSKSKAALPSSGVKATVQQLLTRLQARTHNGDEWRGGDRGRVVQPNGVSKGSGGRKRGGGGARRERDVGREWRQAPVFSLKLTVFSEEDGCII